MKIRFARSICLILAFLIASVFTASAQEITVSGAKVADPTNTGAASASIPIEAPPGRNGIAPRLSIDYNSNRGNGWLGVGWELEVGEIQRSTKHGVNYSANDYLYLSGGASSELVARPDWGTNYYGSKTEGGFTKLYYNSSTGGWEVATKDGTKYYYGSTAASRQDNASGVFRWCLDRVQDSNGNYMIISYVKDQGEIYLDRIDYTGNTYGLSPTNYVQFYRESRSDTAPMYTSNSLVKTAYRLQRIEVYGGGQLARKYVLSYSYSSGTSRSILSSVTQYGNDGTTALPATTMQYQTWADPSFSSGGSQTVAGFSATGNQLIPMDINGDGRMDFIIRNSNGVLQRYISDGAAFQYSGEQSVAAYSTTANELMPMDINGDGRMDFIIRHDGGTLLRYTSYGTEFQSNGSQTVAGFSTTGNQLIRMDFNGNGSDDFIIRHDGGTLQRFLSPVDKVDMLVQINNSLGGTTTITYKPSTAYANHMLPFAVQTVSSISVNDGNGNTTTTNYTYAGGKYIPAERDFRGFDYVKATGMTGTTSETWYSQSDTYKGLPLDQIVKDASGNIYSRSISTYQYTTPYTGVTFPYLQKKDDYLCDGAATDPSHLEACKWIATNFEYDTYGNMTRKYFWGDVNVEGDGKDEYTVYEADLAKWQFRPVQSYVYDSNDVVKAMAWLSYDSRGNLVAKTAWLEGGSSPVTSYDYNIYGNQIAVTDPKGNVSTVEYDPTYTYLVSATNPLGHTASVTYDYRTGKPLSKTDPNGNVATFEYDPFGRLLEAVNPHDGASASAWKESYYDGLGRVIKTRTPGPDNKIIITETKYNNKGQVSQASLPYFADTSDNPLETKRWTTFTYDVLGRATRVDNPDTTYVRKQYNQNRTTMIDANGHVKVEEKDVYGKLVKVEEYEGIYPSHSLYATTTYEYDILGNLLYVTDARGNVTTMVYDTLSRKIAMDDPDMGVWSYQYDDNGNLVSQTDAKSQTITFTYDELNRIKRKHYEACTTCTDIVYEYDDPNVPNSVGRLTKVTDASGMEQYAYDLLGRAYKITKTIDNVPYTTETTYDALGRTASIKYPDGEVVSYSYDTAGDLVSVPGYVNYANFNALGQPTSTIYYNGVTTVQQYYPDNNRLYSITTNSPTQVGIQNISYEYDNAGNVGKINDFIDSNRTQTFTYDHLNRLTRAESIAYGSTLTYEYNQIGNMTYNSQMGAYYYGTSRPHAVIQAGANIYQYDDNGNMIVRGGKSITYDYDNRATTIVGSSGAVQSMYDFTGQRTKKTSSAGTTIYINELYECTNGTCTKYIFANTTRIASKSLTATYYFHKDHLGSSSIVTDAAGNKVEEIYYYPFGGTRSNNGIVNVRYKFTDQEEDSETGLYYYGARYYDLGCQ